MKNEEPVRDLWHTIQQTKIHMSSKNVLGYTLTLITPHPWDIMEFFPYQQILWQSGILHFNSILILTTVSIDPTVKDSVSQDYPLLQMPIVNNMLPTYPQILTWLYMGSSLGFLGKQFTYYCLFITKDI